MDYSEGDSKRKDTKFELKFLIAHETHKASSETLHFSTAHTNLIYLIVFSESFKSLITVEATRDRAINAKKRELNRAVQKFSFVLIVMVIECFRPVKASILHFSLASLLIR